VTDLLTYWHERLRGAEPALELPTDRRRHAPRQPHRLPVEFPASVVRQLRALAGPGEGTLRAVLAALLQTLLFRCTGQEDVLIGCLLPSSEPLVPLPLRCFAGSDRSFRDFLHEVQENISATQAHQPISREGLHEIVRSAWGTVPDPVFRVLFALTEEEIPGVTCDLGLFLRDEGDSLVGGWGYDGAIFDEGTIVRLARHFRTLLEGVLANPTETLSRLPLLTPSEWQHLVVERNQTRVPYPRDSCVHELFEEQADIHPDRVAVVFGQQTLTYAELNVRANRLAHHLRRLGVGPDVPVGICVQRSVDTVVGLLGILKAGGAYVPFDPAFPPARLALLLADVAGPVFLTQKPLLANLPVPSCPVLCLDTMAEVLASERADNPPRQGSATSLAYVIYTSGSTGTPKGVCVEHRGVVRLVRNMDYIDFGPDDTFLHVTSLSFDPSTFEIWMPLLNGARLAIFPPRAVTLGALGKCIRQLGVTALQLTTPMFHLMVDENPEALAGVRSLVSGGEAFSPDHVRRALESLPNTRLSLCYGPTENTTITTAYRPASAQDLLPHATVPLGYPIANSQVYVLDQHLQPVPIGVTGEIYAGGDGVARGYLNRPELTAERFLPDPFHGDPGARLYRTGDLGRYLSDGNLEFRGRIDHQVKIRGYRIELGEIETVLRQHPDLREAAVLARDESPGKKSLLAYIVPGPGAVLDRQQLTAFLAERLPEYMIPAAFVLLEAMPLSPGGKLDRRRLPEPGKAALLG
jgi:amino acid adenylation domain-containing protein